MAKGGPIIVIEDDKDDQELLAEVFRDIAVPNEIKYFDSCEVAYEYLKTTKDSPFIVFSDINLPGMNGSDLKRLINEDAYLRRKSVPYIFLSTTTQEQAVLESYECLSQGFFTKPASMAELKTMISSILHYWNLAKHPNPDLQ
jgi:DNA-binding response OmpR family regulator